jgi:hypothetical protein
MILLFLLLVLLLGGLGLFVKTLWWMLIIAGAIAIVGVFYGYSGTGYGGRRRWW